MFMSRYDEAEANLRVALKKFPDHVNTVVLLGNMMIMQKRCADALALFKTYDCLVSSSSVLNLQTLRCMLKEKQYEQATKMIASFQSKNSPKTLLVSGELNLRQGNIDSALSDLYRIAATPNDYIVNYYLGVVYLLQGETDLALSYLAKSLRKNSQHLQTNLLIAVIHLLKHDYVTASKYATWSAQLDPASVSAHTIRPRSWDRPLYAFRGGFKGAGASSTDSKIAANIERGF